MSINKNLAAALLIFSMISAFQALEKHSEPIDELLDDLDGLIGDFSASLSSSIDSESPIAGLFSMGHQYSKSIGSLYYNTHSTIDLLNKYWLYDLYFNQLGFRNKYQLTK